MLAAIHLGAEVAPSWAIDAGVGAGVTVEADGPRGVSRDGMGSAWLAVRGARVFPSGAFVTIALRVPPLFVPSAYGAMAGGGYEGALDPTHSVYVVSSLGWQGRIRWTGSEHDTADFSGPSANAGIGVRTRVHERDGLNVVLGAQAGVDAVLADYGGARGVRLGPCLELLLGFD